MLVQYIKKPEQIYDFATTCIIILQSNLWAPGASTMEAMTSMNDAPAVLSARVAASILLLGGPPIL